MSYAKHRGLWSAFIVLGAVATVSAGCGKPSEEAAGAKTSLSGVTGYGAQCPYGQDATPFVTDLDLMNCPVNLDKVELTEPLDPLKFKADCGKRTLSIRNFKGTMDSSDWEFRPDGTFYIKLEKPSERLLAHLKNDGNGHENCSVPLQLEVTGTIDCQDRDRAKIKVEGTYTVVAPTASVNLPGGATHPNAPSPTAGAAAHALPAGSCSLPASCFFHTNTTVRQCM